jgi:hypothetical protein
MNDDVWTRFGAAAGAIAIALYVAAALVMGTPPGMDASGAEVARHAADNRTRLQVGSAIHAAWAPLFVWFLATVASLARERGPGAWRASVVAFGCGLVFITLFLVDVTSIAIRALRPGSMASSPELASALRDLEWLAIGMATPMVCALLAAFAVLALRDAAVWPRWLGRLAVLAAVAYALRIGMLFTTADAFAADGVLGLWVPVVAATGWITVASIVLVRDCRSGPPLVRRIGRKQSKNTRRRTCG